MAEARRVVSFWQEAGRDRWFAQDDAFDALCRDRFLATYDAARAGEFSDWRASAHGALALVILLDQLPRNMFRNTAAAWSTDHQALAIAELAVERGFDRSVAPVLRDLSYLPFMHAEDAGAQARSVTLYTDLANADALHFAEHHHAIIARFGRFPHRNEALGRRSTPAELAFLATDGFRG